MRRWELEKPHENLAYRKKWTQNHTRWQNNSIAYFETDVFEPHLALFPKDPDPLVFYKVLSQKASNWLSPKGKLYFELNEKYANLVCDVLRENGFGSIETVMDMQGKDRFARGILIKWGS